MTRTVSHDPIGCIDQFLEWLEVKDKQAVEVKLGRRQALDTQHFSNICTGAAAHASIPVTPLSGQRRRTSAERSQRYGSGFRAEVKLDDDHPFTPEQGARLREVFVRYCNYGPEKHSQLYMSRPQWLKFGRDMALVSEDAGCDYHVLNQAYDRFADESAEGGGGGSGSGSAAAAPVAASPRMSLSGWQAALADLAARIFPSTTKVDAFQRLFTRHITFYGARPPAMLEDEATALLCTPDVASRMQRYRSSLQTIYKFYAAQQDIKTGDWASVSAAKVLLHHKALLRFAYDFEVVPHLLTSAAMAQCFADARFNYEGADLDRFGFQEFLQFLGRVALVGFRYQKATDMSQLMEFKGSYATAAKSLWMMTTPASAVTHAQGGAAASLTPSQQGTPRGAEHSDGEAQQQQHEREEEEEEGGEGGEPRWLAAASSSSAAASPGSSIHMKPLTASTTGLPQHLANFRPDWVARPRTPASEKPRQPRQPPVPPARYDRAGLPAEFHPSMVAFVEANIAREQQAELDRLRRLMAGRQERRETLVTQRLRREALQVAARQPTPSNGGGGGGSMTAGRGGASTARDTASAALDDLAANLESMARVERLALLSARAGGGEEDDEPTFEEF